MQGSVATETIAAGFLQAAMVAQVRELASRDREVRAHEQAHAAVGGAHAGTPHFQYERGPNGVSYAVEGHVNIDVSEVPGDPSATLEKMQTVRRAALAPANPSPADRAVAAKATLRAAQARAELADSRRVDISDAEGTKGGYVDITL
ncbi:MAG: hypothetical protein H6993_10295 [Pseudomonadales bacterium]|nr:hypothetical protein [Pseudomonadales bacterium]MCP5184344.1 hypothetical protein [Pseudomonadales bacterium]